MILQLGKKKCEYDRNYALKSCEMDSSCTLRLDNRKMTSVTGEFKIINNKCSNNISLMAKNLKIVSLGGLSAAIEKDPGITGLYMIEFGNCRYLDAKEIEKVASLMNGGKLNVYKSLSREGQGSNLTSLIYKKEKVEWRENGAEVIDQLIDVSSVATIFSIIKTTFREKNIQVFDNGEHSPARKTVYWESNKINPRFIETTNAKGWLEIYLKDGNKFLRKETFMNVKGSSVKKVLMEEFDRLEYGTITNGTDFRFIDITENDQELFLTGDCTKISEQNFCQLCLMHQYNLHRIEGSVKQKCNDQVHITDQLQKCYWSHPEPIPCSLQSYETYDSWLDKSVLVCSNLPNDVKEHVKSFRSNEEPQICPTTTTIPTSTTATTLITTSLSNTTSVVESSIESTKVQTSFLISLLSSSTRTNIAQITSESKMNGFSSTNSSSVITTSFNSSKEIPTSSAEHARDQKTTTSLSESKSTTLNKIITPNSTLESKISTAEKDKSVTTSTSISSENSTPESNLTTTSSRNISNNLSTLSSELKTTSVSIPAWEIPSLVFDYDDDFEKEEGVVSSSMITTSIFGPTSSPTDWLDKHNPAGSLPNKMEEWEIYRQPFTSFAQVKIWGAVLTSAFLSFSVIDFTR